LGIITTNPHWPLALLKIDTLLTQLGPIRLKSPSCFLWADVQNLYVFRSIYTISPLTEYERNTIQSEFTFFECKTGATFMESCFSDAELDAKVLWEMPRIKGENVENVIGIEIDEISRIEHI
jgi:hypothetical protein